jgi:hypothetical protein
MNVCCFYLNKLLVLFIFTICFSITSSAQETRSQFWQQVRFGGGIGLSFGDGFFSGTLAPSAIYEFNDQLAFGVGLNGSYNTLKNNYKSTIIGGSVLSLFNVIREIQISSEFELLNVSRNYDSSLGFADENYWYPALFLGGGFRSNNVTFGIRYDVLYNIDRSIYANAWAPFVRVYF